MLKTKILTTASCYPSKVLTNHDLAQLVDTSDQWIMERTGIRERRIANPQENECPSDLATRAARQALAEISMDVDEIDGIICATMTPDFQTPSVACLVQKKLGVSNHCMAFDINAACSGFVYAFNTANAYIKAGLYRNILLIGVDCMSSITDYQDRNCCIIFGDGAGVAILSSEEEGDSDVLATSLRADGNRDSYIMVRHGGSAHPITKDNIDQRGHFIHVRGQETFKSAVKSMAEDCLKTIAKSGFKLEDIDWMIPHQANMRILEALAKKIDFPMEKVVTNIEYFGNTSGATIPTCFDLGTREGKIKRGQLVLLTAFGAGLAWGSTVLRY